MSAFGTKLKNSPAWEMFVPLAKILPLALLISATLAANAASASASTAPVPRCHPVVVVEGPDASVDVFAGLLDDLDLTLLGGGLLDLHNHLDTSAGGHVAADL